MAPFRGTRIRLAVLAALSGALPAHGQIATDGTLGAATSLPGPNFAIPANLGRQAGPNLFHSFAAFSVPTGGSATFSGPASVGNIISRVTGSDASTIDGRLGSTIQGANLFLINPRGILFGPGATLDLSGSFHASTASYLKFADGTRFDATATTPAVLSSAAPEAFGFLGGTGAIRVNGAELEPAPGRAISLVAAAGVELDGARITTRGGNLHVSALAAGEVGLTGDAAPSAPGVAGASAAGPIRVSASALHALSDGASAPGRLVIRGGAIAVADSSIVSATAAAADAPPVVIEATRDLALSGGELRSIALGPGRGADLVLRGANIVIDRYATVESLALASGSGGDIDIGAARALRIAAAATDDDYTIVKAITEGTGAGGSVRLHGDSISLEAAVVRTETRTSGQGGAIEIDGREAAILDGAYITAETAPGSTGAGGAVRIRATDRVTVSGADWSGFPAYVIASTQGAGAGGAVLIRARDILLSGGFVESTTQAAGNAGGATLEGDTIRLEVGGPSGYIAAVTSLSGRNATGSGGPVTLRASRSITVDGFGFNPFRGNADATLVTAQTIGVGRGGDILLEAPLVSVDHGASVATAGFGRGDIGSVLVRAHDVNVLRNASIRSARQPGATGRSGSVRIEGTGTLAIGSTDPRDAASVSTRDSGPTTGGAIVVEMPDVFVGADSSISSSARGRGDAGAITIRAQRLRLTGGTIASDALANGTLPTTSPGAAGAIVLDLAELLDVSGPFGATTVNGLISSLSSGTGAAGDITISAPHILFDGAYVQAGNIGAGRGGRITVRAGDFLMRNGAQVTTGNEASATGAGGSIRVDVTGRFEICCGVGFSGQETGLSATTRGRGAGGDILVTAGALVIDDRGFIISSSEGAGLGNAGRIDVQARTVELRNGAAIRAESLGPGTAGAIRVAASESLQISSGAEVDTEAFGGPGGSITLQAPRIAILDGGEVAASTTGAGAAGQIDIRAGDTLRIAGGSVRTGTSGSGAGGRISLAAPRIEIERLSPIAALSLGDGAAGRIDIHAGEVLRVADSVVTSQTFGRGAGGQVVLSAKTIELAHATVSAGSTGPGVAGAIEIRAADALRVFDGSSITTQALASDGGNIEVFVGNRVHLRGSEISTAVGSGAGAGGNILIDPVFFILEPGSRVSANAFGGPGGNITIVAQYFLSSPDAIIDASSQLGVSGNVQISVPRTDLSTTMKALPADVLDASRLLREACGARLASGAPASSLVGVGRGGLAASPERLATSSYFGAATSGAGEPRAGRPSNAMTHTDSTRLRVVASCAS